MNKKIYADRVVLVSTHICNLKCKLCVEHAPYFPEKYNPGVEYLIKEVDEYFNIVDEVGVFEISGGEPLLCNNLHSLISYLLKYNDRIKNELRIVTNSNIVPNTNLIEYAQKFGEKMFFLVDNYGSRLSKKVSEVVSALKENNINYRVRDYCEDLHFDGWVDFGDFSVSKTELEAQELFSKCIFVSKLGICFEIIDGELHPCIRSRTAQKLEKIPKLENEYIDLFSKKESIQDKKNKFLKFFEIKSLSACKYCNGFTSSSKRYKPAEQIGE